jgi:SPX domain protein involved in polyphosphate accumulation
MAEQSFNRIEKKYIINKDQYHKIKSALDLHHLNIKDIDQHDTYHVSNIYYDTDDHLIIKKSVSKPFFKQKLRLRAYGDVFDDSMICLELKRKIDGYVNKRRSLLRVDEAYQMMNEHRLPEIKDYHNLQVLKEILYYINQYDLKPSVYLYYERETYASLGEHPLRITFDTNITSRRDDLDIQKVYGQKLLNDDLYVMEIKTNINYPIWLNELLTKNNIFSTSFSKYGTEFYNYLNQSNEKRSKQCLNPYLTALR